MSGLMCWGGYLLLPAFKNTSYLGKIHRIPLKQNCGVNGGKRVLDVWLDPAKYSLKKTENPVFFSPLYLLCLPFLTCCFQ